jgi:hypothetical protein
MPCIVVRQSPGSIWTASRSLNSILPHRVLSRALSPGIEQKFSGIACLTLRGGWINFCAIFSIERVTYCALVHVCSIILNAQKIRNSVIFFGFKLNHFSSYILQSLISHARISGAVSIPSKRSRQSLWSIASNDSRILIFNNISIRSCSLCNRHRSIKHVKATSSITGYTHSVDVYFNKLKRK